MGISRKTKPVTSATPSPVSILGMKETTELFLSPKASPYNNFHNGEIRLTTEAEQVTILQLFVLLAQAVDRLEQVSTGEVSGNTSSVRKHAIRLLREIDSEHLNPGRKIQMVQFHTYHIKFCQNGKAEPQTKCYRATNSGQAFQKCRREFPDARLIQGWWQSERNGEYAITCEAPSTIAVVPGPKITAEQTLFGFAHQISLKPRETSWRWGRTGFATKTVPDSNIGELT